MTVKDGTPGASTCATEKPSARNFVFPHIFSILVGLIAVAAIATHIIPAGEYQRIATDDGRSRIDPDTFRFIDSAPAGILDFLTAVPRGVVSASAVVIFVLVTGGMFMVLRSTGIIGIAVDRLGRRFANNSLLMIAVLMAIFAFIASIIGTSELSLVYIPVILPLLIALGYDSVTAAAVALCATAAGFTAGVLNPFTTGLGQEIAEVDRYSGALVRLLVLAALVGSATWFVLRYARKVRRDPSLGLLANDDKEAAKRNEYRDVLIADPPHMTVRHKLAAAATAIGFAVMIFGVVRLGWFMVEMAGVFIGIGIVVGLIAGLTPTAISEAFERGFREVLLGALIAGVARGVAVILEDGQIMDTIVYGIGNAVSGMPVALAALGMFVSQLLFNFVIPSGSGQALVTMPIMAPLSDVLDVTRQTAVLAFQFGDGLGNILFPTSGYFMAALAIAGVPWQKWVRFYLPLFAAWCGIAVVFLLVTQAIGWNG
ncbi:YfcC family protein [Hoyosella rhizosphaerae]|nr:TIGR00366 family protein [Hoyosella rhizosphaerae]MBN4926571.1 YfcC family protein [Hoyosella rhizosphaerae]